jgi:hypothetical protein
MIFLNRNSSSPEKKISIAKNKKSSLDNFYIAE